MLNRNNCFDNNILSKLLTACFLQTEMNIRFDETCQYSNIDAIRSIISEGELKQYELNWGLYGACKGARLDVINLLLSKGANHWNWGLQGACEEGAPGKNVANLLEVANLMISKGANNLDDPLYFACSRAGNLDMINFLISKGASNWNWGLFGACKAGHLNVVNLMLFKGADKLDSGLQYACESGSGGSIAHLRVIILLISKGAKIWDCLKTYDIKSLSLCEHGLDLHFLTRFDKDLYHDIQLFRQAVSEYCVEWLLPDLVNIIKNYSLV